MVLDFPHRTPSIKLDHYLRLFHILIKPDFQLQYAEASRHTNSSALVSVEVAGMCAMYTTDGTDSGFLSDFCCTFVAAEIQFSVPILISNSSITLRLN